VYEREKAQIEKWMQELEFQPKPRDAGRWKQEEARIVNRRDRIGGLLRGGQISLAEARELLDLLRRAWEELDFLEAASVPLAPAAVAQTPAASAKSTVATSKPPAVPAPAAAPKVKSPPAPHKAPPPKG